MSYQNEIKTIKLLQERSGSIEKEHDKVFSTLERLKMKLSSIEGAEDILGSSTVEIKKQELLKTKFERKSINDTSIEEIYLEATSRFENDLSVNDILTKEDFAIVDEKISKRLHAFNNKYTLDAWDYAIAGSCGLFAAMLDLLCIKAPLKPTANYTQQVNGIFNQWVQKAFNTVLPPEKSKKLSELFPIGGPDSSVNSDLVGAGKVLTPINHRLKSLAHDPILGVIFGFKDMMFNTCTVVENGTIVVYHSNKSPHSQQNLWRYIGTMFGHLLSDVNAPSQRGNRGMGLPAPFMGLLRMLEGIPVAQSNFGKQIEWMYINGYDFRQFVVTSIPMAIMEVLLRVFYIAKECQVSNRKFCEVSMETVPGKIHPRFRLMLAIAYGTSSAVNAGKMYITQNILNANYASWMGLVWNGFFALKWGLLDKHLKCWEYVTEEEIKELDELVDSIENLYERAEKLNG